MDAPEDELGRQARVQSYSESLVFEPGQVMVSTHPVSHNARNRDVPRRDVDEREVIHAGALYRQNDPLKRSVNVWKELYVVLFDNYLVMAKLKGSRRLVWKNPVRVEFLALDSLTNRPVQRSNTLSRMIQGRASTDSLSSFPFSTPHDDAHDLSSTTSNGNTYYPLSFHVHGKHNCAYTLFAPTLDARNAWRRRLRDAIAARRAAQEARAVFTPQAIAADMAVSQDAPAAAPGLELVAVGTEDALRRVMSLKHVTQLAYLAEHGLMVILADKVLYAVDIQCVVPSGDQQPPHTAFGLRAISAYDKPVHFFGVGRQHGKTMVIFKRKKGASICVRISVSFRCADYRSNAPQEFFLPCETHDILFLKTKLCILCSKGFELMDLRDLSSVTIPQEADMRRVLGKRAAPRAIAMFRIREDEFLLCYDGEPTSVVSRGSPN
ncbi:CNH domain-containing protein [Epithele typhae]|uniref:CNH domain-containing protein n=1 Tax=Epithele typhae TaxID=378194 RepID=UPI0020074004|nr:CNH domain-containing protein [Epithele typhae]KAH9925626.1 CNH domain-containing protein [Epithele typhae]